MKRRKAKVERKEETIQLRVTAEQKHALTEKAKRRGLTLSAWLLSLGVSAPERPPSPE